MKKRFWQLAGVGVIIVIIAAGFVYWYGFLRKEKPMEKIKADFELSADSLFSLFVADEKTATEKFGGKVVLLNSDVISIDQDERGIVTIVLVDPMMGVTCTFDSLQVVKQKPELDALHEGQTVVVKGRCDGMLVDVKISKCMIIK